MMKTVLVTGAGGFIGNLLVRELLQNDYRVIAFDRFFFGGEVFAELRADDRNCLEVGGQAAMMAGGCGSLAAWKRCPRPMPSVPL
jgi:nucleoside-diphosphate-sugar epimerase